jgi:Domain of unknown function (DUF6379)
MENNFSALLLHKQGMRVDAEGVEIDVRLPWYRSLPLSVVEVASLSVDGRAIPPQDIRFEINAQSFRLDQLHELTSEFWFVLDRAVLRLPAAAAGAGPEHQVELQLNLYPPYIPHLTWVTRVTKTLRVQSPATGSSK